MNEKVLNQRIFDIPQKFSDAGSWTIGLGRYSVLGKPISFSKNSYIFHGFDHNIGIEVALKIMDLKYDDELGEVGRSQREAITAAKEYPGMVRVYNFFTTSEFIDFKGASVLVMALKDPETELGWIIKRNRNNKSFMPFSDVVDILGQLAFTVDYMANKDLFHRDLKPSNIFRSNDSRVEISDFGIATGVLGDPFGTAAYVPIELFNPFSTPANITAEIYSLGAITYELITNQRMINIPVVNFSSLLEILHVLNDSDGVPRRAWQTFIDVPEEILPDKKRVFYVLNNALRKRPSDRYQTAIQFAQALASCGK